MSYLQVKLQLLNYRIKRMAPRIVRENIHSGGYNVESLEHYMKVTDGKWVLYYPYSKRHRDPMLLRGIYCIEEGPGYSRVYRETTKSRSKNLRLRKPAVVRPLKGKGSYKRSDGRTIVKERDDVQ